MPDASSLLALLPNEADADVVAGRLRRCVMSAVSLSEVVVKLTDRGVPALEPRAVLDGLDLDVRAFDAAAAFAAGELRHTTRDAGLSLGGRACLALAMRLGVAAVTADRAWVGLAGGSPRIEQIR